MGSTVVFTLAILAALADVIVILTWLKIEPNQIFRRQWWTMREIKITGGKFILVLVLAVVSLVLSSYGFYATRHPDVGNWRSPNQETIYAKTYVNETVELDGKIFDHCHFENVKLLYLGRGPISIKQSDFKGQVWIGSDNIAIRNFGIINTELEKAVPLIRLHGWVEMDKNGNPISIQ